MKIYFLYLAFISFTFLGLAQENEADSSAKQPNTIIDEYNKMVDDGGSWKEYKTVKKVALADFKVQLIQLKDVYVNETASLKNEIANHAKETKDLNEQLTTIQNNLAELEEEKHSMQFLGNNLDKSLYQSIVFGVIGVLILILIILIVKFKTNSVATKEALETLSSTEKDFEEYKRNSLEKQQILGRQLLDEKNKVSKPKTGGAN